MTPASRFAELQRRMCAARQIRRRRDPSSGPGSSRGETSAEIGRTAAKTLNRGVNAWEVRATTPHCGK